MIGLKRNTVTIVKYDPDWAMLALEACRSVRNACGELLVDVQHVGSTAVPGLPAKPILDVAAAPEYATIDSVSEIAGRLTRIGYLYRGDKGDAGGHLFVLESSHDLRTVHLHLVEHGSSQWRDYLRFRDVLRLRPAIRQKYADLKRAIADIYRADRGAYTASKAGFILKVLHSSRDSTEQRSSNHCVPAQ